jgi:hypothetical protein
LGAAIKVREQADWAELAAKAEAGNGDSNGRSSGGSGDSSSAICKSYGRQQRAENDIKGAVGQTLSLHYYYLSFVVLTHY